MTDKPWLEVASQLAQQMRQLRRDLVSRNIHVEGDPDAPLNEQFAQLQKAVVDHLNQCIDQVATLQQHQERQGERELHLLRFIEEAPVAIAMFNREMRYMAASHRWMSDYGLDERKIIGQSHYAIFPEITEAWKAVHQRALAGEIVRAKEDRFVRANGDIQWLRWEVRPWYEADGSVGGVIIFTEDITDLKAIGEQLQRQNRALRLLSATNEALVRTRTEQQLLQRVCDIAIDVGGYRLAWVGYLEEDSGKMVRPIAHSGADTGYLATHMFSWDENRLEGQGPLGQAVRARRSVSIDDMQTAPFFEPWRQDALERGYRSGIVLPLIANDDILGVFALYRGEPYHFTADECTLLTELADDIAFGIITLRTRTARQQAEEALRKSESRYRTIVETAQEGIWVLNSNLQATYANHRLAEMLGYPIEAILGRTIFDFIAPDMLDAMRQHMEKRKQGAQEVYEFRFQRSDGSDLWALVSGSPMRDEHEQFTGTFGMLTDVTDQHNATVYQREFARRTIEAATEGKLIISERSEIYQLVGEPIASWEICHVEDLEKIRHAVSDIARAAGMGTDRIDDFLICISEAATNAFKHAGAGRCSLYRQDDSFFALIADEGSGILPMHLPELALTPGYTTGVSLGMGYKAIISLADKVYLATGPDGTVVGIQMAFEAPSAPPMVFPGLSDNW